MQRLEFIKLNSKKRNREIYYFNALSLGKGGFGEVYYGVFRNKSSEPYQIVAVKKIDTEMTKAESNKQDQEISTLKELAETKVEGVVKIIEVIEEDFKINPNNEDRIFIKKFLILEFGNNGTLEQLLQKNHLSDLEIRCIFKELAMAIKFMHEHKIMHRDIKPNNVVFMDGIAKFIDFGAARKLSEDEMAKTCIGTKYSQTPEILLGKEYDYKGDVFSLGVLLYSMYYRRLPFFKNKEDQDKYRGNELDLYKKILRDDKIDQIFTNEIYIDESGKNIIKGMLNLDENKRLSAVDICNHEYLKFNKAKITEPKKFKKLQKNLPNVENEMKEAFNKEFKKQILQKIRDRFQFEKSKALFINKVLGNFVKLGPLSSPQVFSNAVVSLAYLNLLHISTFSEVLEEKAKPTLMAKEADWKKFYQQENKDDNPTFQSLEGPVKIVQKNYQDMCAAVNIEFLGKQYQKLLTFDKNTFDIFKLLQKAIINIFQEILPNIDNINEKETSDFVTQTLYDLFLVLTMGSSLNYTKVGKFVNFEKYREMKTIPQNIKVMRERLAYFMEKIVPSLKKNSNIF